MGVKISSLPSNILPYSGSETLPIVQGGETRAGTLSSFVNYLSGALPSGGSDVSGLSGNWQNTYTTFSSNSANYAVKNANNNFTTTQTISSLKTNAIVFDTVDPSELVIDNVLNIYMGQYITPNSTDNILIGSNIETQEINNIIIGYHIGGGEFVLNSYLSTYIGHNATNLNISAIPEYNSQNTIIGDNNSILDNSGDPTNLNSILGSSNNIKGHSNVIIGSNNSDQGNNNIIIGQNNQDTFGYDSCIILGSGVSPNANNQLVIGNGIVPTSGSVTASHSIPVKIGDTVYYIILAELGP